MSRLRNPMLLRSQREGEKEERKEEEDEGRGRENLDVIQTRKPAMSEYYPLRLLSSGFINSLV